MVAPGAWVADYAAFAVVIYAAGIEGIVGFGGGFYDFLIIVEGPPACPGVPADKDEGKEADNRADELQGKIVAGRLRLRVLLDCVQLLLELRDLFAEVFFVFHIIIYIRY